MSFKSRPRLGLLLGLGLILAALAATTRIKEADPFLAYEDRESKVALAWAAKENERTNNALGSDPRVQEVYEALLKYADSPDRIICPHFFRGSDLVRNFWRDEKNPLGLIRQTTAERFLSGDYQWRTVFDLDELSRRENKTLILDDVIYPPLKSERALLRLSDGGRDAAEIREYDFTERSFVKDGFRLPESKAQAVWLDEDNLVVAADFKPAEQTESGLPRVVKLWRRGGPWAEARTIFEIDRRDVQVMVANLEIFENEFEIGFIRQRDFFTSEFYLYRDGQARLLHLPAGARVEDFQEGRVLAYLRSDLELDGRTIKSGSLVHGLVDDLLNPGAEARLEVLFEPDESSFYSGLIVSGRDIYLATIENVQSRIYQYRREGERFQRRPVPVAPMSLAFIVDTGSDRDFVLVGDSGFLSPTALYQMDRDSLAVREIQREKEWFRPGDYVVHQEFAVSPDQTRVPYFLVHKKGLVFDGRNPVYQYGYGGFEVSLYPYYIPDIEFAWLRRGGVYVQANIRGGGEYGPAWHQAALKTNRPKAFEDFIAVSEDLIQKKITSPGLIGIEGASNGGLLAGAALTRRPDLYGAAVIDMPLLDMLRYHLMPPGASWTAEYGDPENPEERTALAAYSPYHNLRAGRDYPAPFIQTSTWDDRVHPGHGRKFAKKLEALGLDYYYYENTEGGHGIGVNNKQAGQRNVLVWVYFYQALLDRPKP